MKRERRSRWFGLVGWRHARLDFQRNLMAPVHSVRLRGISKSGTAAMAANNPIMYRSIWLTLIDGYAISQIRESPREMEQESSQFLFQLLRKRIVKASPAIHQETHKLAFEILQTNATRQTEICQRNTKIIYNLYLIYNKKAIYNVILIDYFQEREKKMEFGRKWKNSHIQATQRG